MCVVGGVAKSSCCREDHCNRSVCVTNHKRFLLLMARRLLAAAVVDDTAEIGDFLHALGADAGALLQGGELVCFGLLNSGEVADLGVEGVDA